MLLISVIVCTYNRSDLLALALETLCQQNLDTSLFEVLVVDNNSSDDTKAVTASFTAKQHNIRYILETKQGLSHARNRGWHEAQADYIAYCDDDCKLPAQWLQVAAGVIADHAPAVFGGSFMPFYVTEPPHWFDDKYSTHQLIDYPAGELKAYKFLGGGNLFIHRDDLALTNGFDGSLGMTENKIAYAEETFFIEQLLRQKPDALIYFHPDLAVYHLIRDEKMSLNWRLRDCFALGRDARKMIQDTYPEKRVLPYFMLERSVRLTVPVFKTIERLIRLPFRNRQQYPHWQNYIYETMCQPAKSAGNWWAQVKFYQHNRTRTQSQTHQS